MTSQKTPCTPAFDQQRVFVSQQPEFDTPVMLAADQMLHYN